MGHPLGVSIAAKTLINTFRELNPAMLHKKDRVRITPWHHLIILMRDDVC
jgi:sulfite reductase beta subunit-like hemoprotein